MKHKVNGFARLLATGLFLCAGVNVLAMGSLPSISLLDSEFLHTVTEDEIATFSTAEQTGSQWQQTVRLAHINPTEATDITTAVAYVKSHELKNGQIIRDYPGAGSGGNNDHFLVGVTNGDGFLEFSARRIMRVNSEILQIVYLRREYGSGVGPTLSRWMQENGEALESQLLDIPVAIAEDFLKKLR
ncbi:MAG: hypothetical protein KTR33_12250 [Gammaproteobacteria bacterium]|nr:hypothetical protein [Gammaproteobacteria bacterium]